MKDHIEKCDFSAAISPIEEIVEEARNGRMYILVDAEDRENEGDLIIPAQFATPAAVNFMAKHGRGLICLSLSPDRAKLLQLDMMARENRTSMKTAFTVSIEAREGVTTGISAHDRAHTIAVAIDPTKGADDIVSPGHVFPLVAKDGGVLVTEMGLAFANLRALADIDRADMIMIPGGPGQTDAMLDPGFMAEVKRLGESATYVTSVCTGSLILAAAGLLTGKRAGPTQHAPQRG